MLNAYARAHAGTAVRVSCNPHRFLSEAAFCVNAYWFFIYCLFLGHSLLFPSVSSTSSAHSRRRVRELACEAFRLARLLSDLTCVLRVWARAFVAVPYGSLRMRWVELADCKVCTYVSTCGGP